MGTFTCWCIPYVHNHSWLCEYQNKTTRDLHTTYERDTHPPNEKCMAWEPCWLAALEWPLTPNTLIQPTCWVLSPSSSPWVLLPTRISGADSVARLDIYIGTIRSESVSERTSKNSRRLAPVCPPQPCIQLCTYMYLECVSSCWWSKITQFRSSKLYSCCWDVIGLSTTFGSKVSLLIPVGPAVQL